MSQLKGKVAIVTGGGRGIGRAHALRLAKDGAAVIVNDLGGEFSGVGAANSAPAEEVVATIKAAGGNAVANATDLSDWDGAAAVVEAAVKAFGRLDIVVNNAGITRFAGIEVATKFDWERTIAVNLTGTAALCHWAAVHWRKQGPQAGRRIINTTSGVGLTPVPGDPMYTASKAGVAAITISGAIELAELGVRVNAIAPVARSRISETVAGEMMKPPQAGFDRMSPDNVAAVVAYLASPACRFTGRILGIIGDSLTVYEGWTIAHHFSNGAKRWEQEEIEKTLGGIGLQQLGKMHGLGGADPLSTPSDETLAILAKIEKA